MSFAKLTSVISKMPSKSRLSSAIGKFGDTGRFRGSREHKTRNLPLWSKLQDNYLKIMELPFPKNAYEDHIILTEEGKLWHYPIDNEQGLDSEKKVPFEDHVFFAELLDQFPRSPYIQSFMEFVVLGLGNNPHMTAERKREVISWYRNYFIDKAEIFNASGFEYKV